MDQLEPPIEELWNQRREWFEQLIHAYGDRHSRLTGEQATALIFEVQCCFCAGAWAAVLILACAVIEANGVEVFSNGQRKRAGKLWEELKLGKPYDDLRLRRNALVHVTQGSPGLTLDNQYDDRPALESEARQAVQLMFQAFYPKAGA